MNAKQELAGRILLLVDDEIKPDTQRVLDMLTDYQIEYNIHMDEMDFQRQMDHFIFAKRSEGITTATLYNYKLYLIDFSDYINKAPIAVTTGDLRDYIGYLTETRHLKNVSAQAVINILRSFFGWLHMEEIIPRNPMARVKSFHIDKMNSRHPLSPEQLEMLRNACETYREKALVEFMYSSGCRLGEVVQIELDTVDFNNRCVSVIGKGNKRRTLYFSIRAKLMLQHYLDERPRGTTLFSCGKKPYNRLGRVSIERIIRDLGVRAGIGRVYPHILRHTLATDLLNFGMDITIIQQILGHANVGTTQIYAEVNQESVQREYRKFVA